MTRIAIKDLLGRKLRLTLTSLAIVLGVAMVCGTYVLTDTIKKGFSDVYTAAYAGADAVVTGKEAFGGFMNAPSFPESVLTRVRQVPGVAAADGVVADHQTQFVGRNGKAIVHGGAPNLAYGVSANADESFNPMRLVSGSWPKGPDEVAIDRATADGEHLRVGDPVRIASHGPVRTFRVTGIATLGGSTSIGGATIALFDLPTAQRLFRKPGRLDEVDVRAAAGVSKTELVSRIRAVLPPHTQVRTGAAQAQKAAQETNAFLDFLQYFLLAFGGVALFVGSFVIANTLSITIAQRTREFATLRTMGASRRQVLTIVVVEGLVVGAVASLLGLVLGVALAKGLSSLFDAIGFTMPRAGTVLEARTVVVSLLVGILITLAASLRPALRATRVPPIAAVREGAVLPPSRLARFGPAAALATCAVAFAMIGYGAFGHAFTTGQRLLGLGLGVLLLFLGVAMIAPRVVRPLASTLGWPATRVGGVAGALARSNSMRNPARTASTAAALMIGLALVTVVAVLAAGLKASFEDAVRQLFHADYALVSQNGFTPLTTDAAAAIRRVPGVTVVSGVRAGQGRFDGSTVSVTAVDPGFSQLIRMKWTAGSNATLERLGAGGAVVDKSFAKKHHLVVGSPLRVQTPAGTFMQLRLVGIFDPPSGGSPFGAITASAGAFDRHYSSPENVYAFLNVRGGVTKANTAKLDAALASFPDGKIQTERQFEQTQEQGINTLLNMLYVLLALSIVVSLFGIVNTLVLTVFERTREIGMLRAVGMTRRQVRRMIRHESVVTALIGAALGIPLGVVLAALVGRSINFVAFAVPWGTLVVFVVAAIVVGLLAAIFPARRAGRLNVLEALHYE